MKEISVANEVIRVQVIEKSIVQNDMNAPWVKEHFERYGRFPDPFDGC